MKIDRFGNRVIGANDEYYNEVHCEWMRVPPHWVNDLARNYSHKICHIDHEKGE
jgi:hypothetical protein